MSSILSFLALSLLVRTCAGCVIPPSSPAPVYLGQAADFVILAKAGVSTVPNSVITGDVGVSPIAATALTGFSLVHNASLLYSTSSQVEGLLYAADFAIPTPPRLTTAILNMEAAYTDASGRVADFTDIGAGSIGGLTFRTGVYRWSTTVNIATDITISGGTNDQWIFIIPGTLTMASNMRVILTGGAAARNIFWAAAGTVAIGTGAHFEGTILAATDVTILTKASMNGHIFAQTAVALQMATVTKPL